MKRSDRYFPSLLWSLKILSIKENGQPFKSQPAGKWRQGTIPDLRNAARNPIPKRPSLPELSTWKVKHCGSVSMTINVEHSSKSVHTWRDAHILQTNNRLTLKSVSDSLTAKGDWNRRWSRVGCVYLDRGQPVADEPSTKHCLNGSIYGLSRGAGLQREHQITPSAYWQSWCSGLGAGGPATQGIALRYS